MKTLLTTLFLTCATAASAAEPQRFFPDDLGQDGRITLFPTISPDGQTLYITQSEGSPIWKFPQRLKRSEKTENGWTAPTIVDLGEEARADGGSISPDGRTLYFSWAPSRPQRDNGAENFDLFTLDITDASARPERIEAVNTVRTGRVATLRYVNNEGSPSIDAKGRLYFFSERLEQGPGERDLFVSHPTEDGFSSPKVVPLSTKGREGAPWVTPDGKRLFYAIAGDCGGTDIFVSERRAAGEWTKPVNLGCDVNSPSEDFGARLSPSGDLLFTSDRAFDDTAKGLLQVWWVEGWDR